jgi:hypothetical protein
MKSSFRNLQTIWTCFSKVPCHSWSKVQCGEQYRAELSKTWQCKVVGWAQFGRIDTFWAAHLAWPVSLCAACFRTGCHRQLEASVVSQSRHQRWKFVVKETDVSVKPQIDKIYELNLKVMWPCVMINSLLQNQLDALISQIYSWNGTLHVSNSSSVHDQEFFTVHTAMVYVIQVWWQLVSRSICFCSQAVSKPVCIAVCTSFLTPWSRVLLEKLTSKLCI